MYTTDIQDSGTVSATDAERLPPGGFSLRDGFPDWFGRGARRSAERRRSGSSQTPSRGGTATNTNAVESPASETGSSVSPTPGRRTGESYSGGADITAGVTERVSTCDVLRYVRSAFDDAEVLDVVPLEAAGNPGAWHAWRAHRIKTGAICPAPPAAEPRDRSPWHDGLSDDEESSGSSGVEGHQRLPGGTKGASLAARRPGEWSWEGVWEVRVKKGVEASLADAVLFGNSAGDDPIKFFKMEGSEVEAIQQDISRSLEPQRKGIV